MLAPGDRRLLVDALRPPAGYELDRAVGTTYSLDLFALLTTPIAFTFFDFDGEDADGEADSHYVLEALRRTAERITVFCQAGRIQIPNRYQPLFIYLETTVVEVAAPLGGAFHPKVWILRYTSEDRPSRYRVLFLSRNLTFDRSWDTLLVLDGELTDRTYAFSTNHPLGDFVAALPHLARRGVPEALREEIETIQHEVRRVQFELPEGFEEYRFHPIGIEGHDGWPFEGRVDRFLVVSPFLAKGTLARLTSSGSDHMLVSRPEELDFLDRESFARFERVYQLSPAADVEPFPGLAEGDSEDGLWDTDGVPTGLHAKLFVADAGWDARLWTGSANATDAAFEKNVEFLVELRGKRSRCGVDAVLGTDPDEKTSLLGLLERLEPPEEKIPSRDGDLERRAREVRRRLAGLNLAAIAEEASEADDDMQYRLRLIARDEAPSSLPADTDVLVWPITLSREVGGCNFDPSSNVAADFGLRSPEALTSFFAFEMSVEAGGEEAVSRFVLNLVLEGGPKNRVRLAVRSILKDSDEVLRFLLLLLSVEEWEEGAGLLTGGSWGSILESLGGDSEAPLLETLLRALDRRPERIDEVHAFLKDLREEGKESEELLPPGFEAIWSPVWEARMRSVS